VPTSTADTRGRNESPELANARELAAQLRRDSDFVGVVIEWAVGVFRSDGAAATETVVMSNEGFGYIPRGVYLPRGVQLLATDPIVTSGFEKRWTGWPDPAPIMVEYAALRAEQGGGHLIAAVATNRVEPFKTAGVEYALCERETDRRVLQPPVLDAVHVDRFEVTYPELSARVQRLCAVDHDAVLERVVRDLAGRMMFGVKSQSEPYPAELRQMWDRLSVKAPVTAEDWKSFASAANTAYLDMVLVRPMSIDGDPAEEQTWRRAYEQHWLIVRTIEVLSLDPPMNWLVAGCRNEESAL
jgi:hypothetical protein